MIYKIFTIRDQKSGFLNITLDQNEACAIRNFEHACSKTDSLMFTHASDYDLYEIGEFDTDTGLISPLTIPKIRVSGADYAQKGDK